MANWAQKASDNFTRANENPLSGGGNWTGANATQTLACKIVSNIAYGINNGAQNISTYTGRTWNRNQYATVYSPLYSGGNLQGPALRCATAGNTGYYYRFRRGPGANNSSGQLFRIIGDGTSISMEATFVQGNINSIVAGTITMYLSNWTFSVVDDVTGLEFAAFTDTNHYFDTGSPGLMIYTSDTGPPGVSSWAAGEDIGRTRFPLPTFKG